MPPEDYVTYRANANLGPSMRTRAFISSHAPSLSSQGKRNFSLLWPVFYVSNTVTWLEIRTQACMLKFFPPLPQYILSYQLYIKYKVG